MAKSSESSASYFQDKRGEINDLKVLLRDIHVERDPKKKREVVRKVIAFDTLGYDCSKLFSEMVIATSTSDIVVKKMAYHFLSHYARENEELATLCINTLTKDCSDADPMVRGLAIRSLSSLRLKSTVEYLLPQVQKALKDPSGYVRRNGVVAVLKLFYLVPNGEEFLAPYLLLLKDMLFGDREAQVVNAVIQTLDEIYRESQGGLVCDLRLFRYLLNRSQDFNEWEMTTVLQVLSRYTPPNQEDMFTAMNLLDPCLRQTNSALVLACAKLFAMYAELVPDLKTSVYFRLKEPLLTMMLTASNRVELKYSTLCHLQLLIQESSIVFEDAFKSFYLLHDEPLYVKKVKLEILPLLANMDNYQEILLELSEYVLDVNVSQAKQAVQAVAQFALHLGAQVVDEVLFKLLDFANEQSDTVLANNILDAFQSILKEYPSKSELIVQALPKFVLRTEPTSASAIWMLGEFGSQLEQAPYLLERLAQKDTLPIATQEVLLTAMLKLFFKQRALEVRPGLELLFQSLLVQEEDFDIRDRAMFCYRLLRQDVFKAAEILLPSEIVDDGNKHDGQALVVLDKFREFNTLSVVYGKPGDQFTEATHAFPVQQDVQQQHAVQQQVDVPPLSLHPHVPDIESPYDPQFELSKAAFQQIWMNELPAITYSMEELRKADVDSMESNLSQYFVKCMASGRPSPNVTKFYFYAKLQGGSGVYLAEVLVYDKESLVDVKVKTAQGLEEAQEFAMDLLEWM